MFEVIAVDDGLATGFAELDELVYGDEVTIGEGVGSILIGGLFWF